MISQTDLTRYRLQVLPPGQNRQQKVALGDSAGVLQCVSIKRGEASVVFKTLPTGHKVSCLTLGRGQTAQRDKIFVAQGQTVFTTGPNGAANMTKYTLAEDQCCLAGARLQ